MKSSIFLIFGISAAVYSTPIVINKNKGAYIGEAAGPTNPHSAHSASEDEYPRIHPILPLPKEEVPNNPTLVDEYPQIYPILQLTKDKVSNVASPVTSDSDPPLKNKPNSVGLTSIGNDDETPIIIKLQPGLNYNHAPSKTQTYNQEPIIQYNNMVPNQETYTNQGVNLQSNYPIPARINPEQTGTQLYQGEYNYSPAGTSVEGNQYVLYQQTGNPQYAYEDQNQYPQQVQQNDEYIIYMVPASNYQQNYNNNGYNRPYYTQRQDGYRPQEAIYSIEFSSPLAQPFGKLRSRIKSALHNLRPLL